MKTIYVAGLSGNHVTEELNRLLAGPAGAIACSDAHMQLLAAQCPAVAEKVHIPMVPVSSCLELIRDHSANEDVIVVTSGDPLFFGLGNTLCRNFPPEALEFLPARSYMQLCFARFSTPWHDAEFLSLHGRPLNDIDAKLHAGKLFIFTDQTNNPGVIARHVIERLGPEMSAHFTMCVGERLGLDDECCSSGSLAELAGKDFLTPNCVILIDNAFNKSEVGSQFGLKERDFHHSRGLITKDEIRAAVLHELCLPSQGVMWDIGAGSGSVSIEAARMNQALSVYAVEQNGVEVENIQRNKKRFDCRNCFVIPGAAPGSLRNLPLPDRIFIGGSGGKLRQIIRYIKDISRKDLRIVVTAVTEATRQVAPELLYACGFSVSMSEVAVRRFSYPAGLEEKRNPIVIISARNQS